jgi:spore germination protein KB
MIEKNKINSLQIAILVYQLGTANFLGIGLNNIDIIAKQDIWISALLGILIGFIPILIFLFIANHRSTLNIIELNQKIFGKVFGTILNIAINALVFFIGIVTLANLTKFIQVNFLMRTPNFVIGLLFMLVVYKAAHRGQEVISRAAVFLFPLGVILLLINTIGLTKFIELKNLKPILEFGISPVLKGGLLFASIYASPIFMLLIVPKNDITDPDKYNRYMLLWYLFGGIYIFIVFFWVMSVLGHQLVLLYNFPIYDVLKKITFFNFIERLENNLILEALINLFFVLAMSVYFIKESIQSTIKITNPKWINIIVATISLAMLLIVSTVFIKNADLQHLSFKYYGWIIGIGFLAISLIISIRLLFDKKQT